MFVGLQKTPVRAAKAFLYLTHGYSLNVDDVVNGAVFHEKGEDLVVVRDISFCSLCEHHLVPFFGKASIAYYPNGKVIGLSKLARITSVFARRLQIQERLTREIADAVIKVLSPKGVAVTLEATHLCMSIRGVQQQGTTTVTHTFTGVFEENDSLRHQYLSVINNNNKT
eukprot:TRINITY_DN2054_c0_g1_i1.p1 TRINITY_DN2054_c0_g1~~TRINITY_DN2054_c0_g1_i1.p1  ORF type:complete len:169 (-),score=37.42 TRINITY_DN2054_c0_g1_i1:48-554(-)